MARSSEGLDPKSDTRPDASEDSAHHSPEEENDSARAYNRTKRILFLVELSVGLTFLVVLLFSGASISLARWLETISGNTWIVVLLYLTVVGCAFELLSIPLDFYGGFVLEHKYGQSTQVLPAWAWDELKGILVGAVIGIPVLETVYWLLRRYPQSWWIIASVMFIVFVVIMANLAPVILMPIFYKFSPLGDEELRRRLLALSEKANARVKGVYEMDISRKTRAANAALVGLGNTRRIVLGDTLLERYEPEEIEVILAHELGHHRNHDMWKGLIFQSIISAVGLYLSYIALNAFSTVLGLRGPADIAGFPLLLLVLLAVSLFFLPTTNAFSRSLERRADAFAIQLTENPDAFISMMGKLGKQNLSEIEPNPIVEFLLFSHPSIGKRIRMVKEKFSSGVDDPEIS